MSISDPYRREVARTAARLGTALSAVAVAITLLGMALAGEPGASAAVPAGTAQIVNPLDGPNAGQPLNSGGSATPFSLKLPAGAACTGDSANAGYLVQSYLVPSSVDPTTLTFNDAGPIPVGVGANLRQPLFQTTSAAYVNQLTALANPAGGPGPVLQPPAFDFALFSPGNVPAGVYNLGLACTKGVASPTQLDKIWNAQITVVTAAGDQPAGFTWTSVTPPTTTTTGVTSSTSTTTVPPSSTTTAVPPSSTTTAVPPSSTTTTVPPSSTTTTVPPSSTTTTVPPSSTTTTPPASTTTTSTVPGSTTTAAVTTTSTTVAATTTSTTAGATTTSTAPDCSTTSTTGSTCVPAGTTVGSSAAPGGPLVVTSDGWQTGSPVTAVLNSDPVTLGTLTASSAGVVSASLTVPSSVTPGAHTLVLTGTSAAGLSRMVRAPVTIAVVTTTTAQAGSSLPKTGSSTLPLVLWSSALMAFGISALLLGRSSRFQPPTP